jgi:hypothetical protein
MAFVAEGGLEMARKRHKREEIVAKLRQFDVLTSQGRSVAEAVRTIGVTEVTYYRSHITVRLPDAAGLRPRKVRSVKSSFLGLLFMLALQALGQTWGKHRSMSTGVHV